MTANTPIAIRPTLRQEHPMDKASAHSPRWTRPFGALLALALALCANPHTLAADKKAPKTTPPALDEHFREERGVNAFTTPSIETLLSALQQLRPLPYETIARELPTQAPSDRARLALSTGAVIAEGFLAVAAEKQSPMEPIGRVLLRHAKGLGVADHVTKHSKSILEKATTKDWAAIRSELAATQRDVEQGMIALRDEEIAHLVALGGWWRGLEITAATIAENYTPERAALLIQPAVLDYFADRISTLNPTLQKTPLWATLDTRLRQVRTLAIKPDHTPPTPDEVKKIQTAAKAVNDTTPTEQ